MLPTFDLSNEHNIKALKELRLKPDYLAIAQDVIQREFTKEWLESLIAEYKDVKPSIINFHPIYHGILTGMVNAFTVEAIELAAYLNYLRATVPTANTKISALVNELKVDRENYYSYLYQLAVTSRIRNISSDMAIEPELDDKTPDVTLSYLGRDFIIEATRLRVPNETRAVDNVFERIAFDIEKLIPATNSNSHFKLIVKNLGIINYEFEIKSAIKNCGSQHGEILANESLSLEAYEYSGTIEELRQKHELEVIDGTKQVYSFARSNDFPSPFVTNLDPLPCERSLVVDLNLVTGTIYKDISDKIERAITTKKDQIRALKNANREIHLFMEIGALLEQRNGVLDRNLDMDKLVKRVNSRAFDGDRRIFTSIALSRRIWRQQTSRYKLESCPLFPPVPIHKENLRFYNEFLVSENNFDFVDNIATNLGS